MSRNIQNHNSQPEDEDCVQFPSMSQTQSLQPKKFPLTSRDRQCRKAFDSADYFMEKDREQKLHVDVTEVPIPDYPHAKTPILKFQRNKKKTFDSAEYFMEREREQKKKEMTPAEANQSQENTLPQIMDSNSQENQRQEQEGGELSCILNYSGNKKPVFKSGRTVKKNFDSADYFMNQQKLKKLQQCEAAAQSKN